MAFGHWQQMDVICYMLEMAFCMCQEMRETGEERRKEEEEE